LCEEYIGRKFGKRDKADLQGFLRGLQVQRTGDSDDEAEKQPPTKYSDQKASNPLPVREKSAPEIVQTAVVKENAPIAKKASAFASTVTESYQAPGPRGAPVKVADFDDIEGVKDRQKKWEEGAVARAEGSMKNVEGYKVDETEETKARKQKWEEGQVVRADSLKANVEGYKVDDTEELKARKKSGKKDKSPVQLE